MNILVDAHGPAGDADFNSIDNISAEQMLAIAPEETTEDNRTDEKTPTIQKDRAMIKP